MCNETRSEYAVLEAKFEEAQQLCGKLKSDINELKGYIADLEGLIEGLGYRVEFAKVANVIGYRLVRCNKVVEGHL